MSQPKKYKAEVVSITNPVDNIYTVEFRSITGRFRYLPGQFMHLALDEYDPSFGWPESRCFSIQSSSGSEIIKITFSVKGRFTKRMAEYVEKGRILDLKLPYGDLFQNQNMREKNVFIAGGTGIAPFLSLFTDPSFDHLQNPILYFGLRSSNYNIYEDDLDTAQKINPTLKIKYIYQDINGILDINIIFKENGLGKTYYISGPQIMVSSFRKRLIDLDLKDSLIKTDDWE